MTFLGSRHDVNVFWSWWTSRLWISHYTGWLWK